VLHRRSNAVREKVVHSMQADTVGLDGNMFRLAVVTSAGTYVKELVHDDFRRTRPSLPDLLGCRTDILALDVEEVCLDWPPGAEALG
jgi:tRNA pseudouridine synthase 10